MLVQKILLFTLAAVLPYLICAVNPAIFLSKAVYHKDIRTLGSGNPGFTNFKRNFGKLAYAVLVFDLFKGALAALLFGALFPLVELDFRLGAAFAGMFAMLGHAFPVWYRFKGGKGFLVLMSIIFCVDWRAGLAAFAVLTVLLLTTHYMSLSTMVAVVVAPITLAVIHIVWYQNNVSVWIATACLFASAVFMIARHKENIVRLFHRNERKFYFTKKG